VARKAKVKKEEIKDGVQTAHEKKKNPKAIQRGKEGNRKEGQRTKSSPGTL